MGKRWRQSEEQLAIGGASGGLEEGKGEEEGFGIEEGASSCGFAWALEGELLGELVDVGCGDASERDLCFSLCHRVHFTPLPPIFEHPPTALDFAVIDGV